MAALQDRLALPARAVPSVNFHITLAFLGAVDEQRVPALMDTAGELDLPAGTLELDRLGAFPRAGVVWLGSSSPPGELLAFQAELAARLETLGFTRDSRPWSPHVTLYRKMRKRFARIPFEAIAWPLDGFCLMQSVPGDGSPIYRPLATWQGPSVRE